MNVLITGASGFLGSNIVRELLIQGHTVKAMVEKGKPYPTLQGLPVTILEGNILDGTFMVSAMKDCSCVIHTAASTAMYPYRSSRQREINITGTKNVLDACLETSMQRLVYVGTANSFGPGTMAKPGDETNPYVASKYGLDYMDSKYEAHLLVLQYVSIHKLNAVIVNPTFMLGPLDTGPSSGKMIIAVCDGKLPGYSPGSKNYIYVKDAAKGVVAAMTKGRTGESYILGNENLSFREMFDKIAVRAGVKAPKIPMPAFLVKAYGRIGSLITSVTGKPADVTYPLAQIACDDFVYTAEKAVRELGLPQTPIEVAIDDAIAWFRQHGYLPK
jgi:dihydroflavonol-4-reductase